MWIRRRLSIHWRRGVVFLIRIGIGFTNWQRSRIEFHLRMRSVNIPSSNYRMLAEPWLNQLFSMVWSSRPGMKAWPIAEQSGIINRSKHNRSSLDLIQNRILNQWMLELKDHTEEQAAMQEVKLRAGKAEDSLQAGRPHHSEVLTKSKMPRTIR